MMMISAARNEANWFRGRCSRKPAKRIPSTSTDRDRIARRLICWRVGGDMLVSVGTTLMGDAVGSGAPQPIHAGALLLTARPHSLHAIKAMSFPYVGFKGCGLVAFKLR